MDNPVRAFCAMAVAVIAQILAGLSIVRPVAVLDGFTVFAGLQLLAAFAQAWLIQRMLPARYREPRFWVWLFLWVFCTLIPVIGGLIVLIACLWEKYFPAKRDSELLASVSRPEFVTYLMSHVSHGSGARLQARLANTQVPTVDRLSALVAIQTMPTRTNGTLLRELLADPIEDIRLIAYGALDQAENEIMQKIYQAIKALELCDNDTERHELNRRLAELHFELVYQNLVQGAVYKHTLEQADRYAHAALAASFSAQDAALWLIRVRVALANAQPELAARYMEQAQKLGFPSERLLPWLAEVAFLKRDYSRVSELLGSLGSAALLPTLKPAVEYWL